MDVEKEIASLKKWKKEIDREIEDLGKAIEDLIEMTDGLEQRIMNKLRNHKHLDGQVVIPL